MGKRKSSKKPQTRIKQVLDKSFRCVFCAHQGSVTCKLDNKNKIGRLDCKDCGQSFQTDITHLSEPVDLYSQWIDACEEANPVDRAPARAKSAGAQPAPKKRRAPRDDEAEEADEDEEEDGDFVEGGRDPAASEEEEELPDLRPKGRKKQRLEESPPPLYIFAETGEHCWGAIEPSESEWLHKWVWKVEALPSLEESIPEEIEHMKANWGILSGLLEGGLAAQSLASAVA
ncbi:hypothetical protein JCM10450v2_005022 [Rhodotorula kratochvilovae]